MLYLENNCIHCGSCVAQATSAGVRMENGRICLNRKAEENWNAIVDACPTCALRFDAREYTLEEVVEEIKKDAVFFQYGGGLTVSGGEPFLQADFLLALLQAAKQEGIHTAIETTLFTSLENVQRILPYIDQIYCDCGGDYELQIKNGTFLCDNSSHKIRIADLLHNSYEQIKSNEVLKVQSEEELYQELYQALDESNRLKDNIISFC